MSKSLNQSDCSQCLDYFRRTLTLLWVIQKYLTPDLCYNDLFYGINVQGEENFTLKSANQIYADTNYSLRSEFQTRLKNHFGVLPSTQNFDFISSSKDCRVVINKQVEELTHSKIKDLIPEGIQIEHNTRAKHCCEWTAYAIYVPLSLLCSPFVVRRLLHRAVSSFHFRS